MIESFRLGDVVKALVVSSSPLRLLCPALMLLRRLRAPVVGGDLDLAGRRQELLLVDGEERSRRHLWKLGSGCVPTPTLVPPFLSMYISLALR